MSVHVCVCVCVFVQETVQHGSVWLQTVSCGVVNIRGVGGKGNLLIFPNPVLLSMTIGDKAMRQEIC